MLCGSFVIVVWWQMWIIIALLLFISQTITAAPIKGGIPMICPAVDKSSTACCYLHCQHCHDQCTENEAESDRQEESDCKGRKTICYQECAVESTAPQNWGTHVC